MEGLLTYKDLGARWGTAGKPMCKRQVLRVCKLLKLEPLPIGYRTKRFRPDDVLRAEDRLATKTTKARR